MGVVLRERGDWSPDRIWRERRNGSRSRRVAVALGLEITEISQRS